MKNSIKRAFFLPIWAVEYLFHGKTDDLSPTKKERADLWHSRERILNIETPNQNTLDRVNEIDWFFEPTLCVMCEISQKTSKELYRERVYKVDSRRGAPMGRANNLPRKNFIFPEHNEINEVWANVPYFDRKVPMSDGVYDAGGAYWGHNNLRVRYSKDGASWQFYCP